MKKYNLNQESDVKDLAYHIKKYLTQQGHDIKHSEILSGISHAIGFKNWNVYSSKLKEKDKLYEYKIPFKDADELFNKGSVSQIIEYLVFTSFRQESDNAMWKGRAISLCSAIIRPLVWMRENDGFIITGKSIYDAMNLENIIELSYSNKLYKPEIEGVRSYLLSLPGYKDGYRNSMEQSETVHEQHGYIHMQFKSLTAL